MSQNLMVPRPPFSKDVFDMFNVKDIVASSTQENLSSGLYSILFFFCFKVFVFFYVKEDSSLLPLLYPL